MNQNLIKVSIALFLLIISSQLFCYGQLPFNVERAIEKLKSADEALRMAAYYELLDYRQQYIAALMGVARDSANPESGRAKSMEWLGHMRATEAIDLLVQQMKMTISERTPSPLSVPRLLYRVPAQEALVHMGKPVVPYMLDLIAESQDPEMRNNARSIIRGVLVLMPQKLRDSFVGEMLQKRVIIAGAEDLEHMVDQVIEARLKNQKQPDGKPTNEGKIKIAPVRILSVEKLKDSDERIQYEGFREITYAMGLLSTELTHKVINDSEVLPVSKRLAWVLKDKIGALREGWEEEVYK